MIHTIKPYGSINESEVLKVDKNKLGFFLVDNAGNLWGIDEATFNKLKNSGY